MATPRVCLLAHDMAPSACFAKLAPALRAVGYDITTFVGDGKPISTSTNAIQKAVTSSDFLLLGMSSSPEFAEIEVVAGEWAREAGVPYGFYSDVTLAVYRARPGAWFHNLASDARLILGLMPEGNVSSIFTGAKCVNTGNPLREEMAFPKITRKESRSRLGVADDAIVILAPGGKFTAGNSVVWMTLFEALKGIESSQEFVVVLTPHPGDTTLRAYDHLTKASLPIYAEICEDAPVQTIYCTKDVMATSEVLAGADIVVEFTTSAGIEAAYQGIPVISLLFEVWVKRFEKESGLRVLETVEAGASIPVYGDVHVLRKTILELADTSTETFQALTKKQREAYPIPTESGVALRNMVCEIQAFISH